MKTAMSDCPCGAEQQAPYGYGEDTRDHEPWCERVVALEAAIENLNSRLEAVERLVVP